MIYFVRPIGGGPVKIGFTDNLDARIPQLQTEFGVRLEVLATLPGDRSTETEIHARFQEIRFKRTEQFLPTPELLEFIGVVLDPPPRSRIDQADGGDPEAHPNLRRGLWPAAQDG